MMLLLPDKISSQCTPLPLPGSTCETAPLICLQNLCYTGMPGFPDGAYLGFCGTNTTVNNPVYYEMIATEESIIIVLDIGGCTGGLFELQGAIIDACPWSVANVLDCNPGVGQGQSMYLHAAGVVVGESYWLLLDGGAGARCDFTISQAYGIYSPEITGEISMLTANSGNVIQGSELSLDITSTLNYVHGYYWVLGWNGDTITSTLPNTIIEVPCDVPPGEYTICARGYSGCDTTEIQVCSVVEVLEFEDVILNPSFLCPAEFPFEWLDLTISEPGIYTQEVQHPNGCYYTATWQIDMYPDFGKGLIDTTVCQFGFQYEDHFYNTPGMYELYYPSGGLNGCDSMAVLHLSMNALNFFVEVTCVDSQYILQPYIIEHLLTSDSISYSWYDCTYDSLLSTSLSFTLDTSGCYCLVADYGFCSDTMCSTYIPAACSQTCSLVQERSCTGDSVLLTSDREFASGATFHWLIDRPDSTEQYYTGTDSLLLDFSLPGCYVASLTIITADSTFSCMDSVCVYSSGTTALLCCDQSICDFCATITVELSGTPPWTLYFSEGSHIDTILDVRTSPYSHIICPPADSTFIYQLTVIDSASQCPAGISGENHIAISLAETPVYSIVQNNDTLCVDNQNLAGYNWKGCASGQSFATTPCFIPTASGCYCVELTAQNGCSATECYDFVISSIAPILDSDILISPIPSKGVLDITLSAKVKLPAHWTLIDAWGRLIENGDLSDHFNTIRFDPRTPDGLYFLKITSATHQTKVTKLIIESP